MSLTTIVEVLGTAIPVKGDNLDTDIIIPARYLKLVTFAPLGQFPFYDQRFDSDGNQKDHPMNEARYQGASVLLVNKNFGCGSSREHAPQALMRWGIKAIVGESFAAIFEGNCRTLGIPAVTVSSDEANNLMRTTEQNPSTLYHLDLEKKVITYNGQTLPFSIPEPTRIALMEGTWNPTSMLLENMHLIRSTSERIPYMKNFES